MLNTVQRFVVSVPSRFSKIRKEKTNISLDGLMNIFGDHVSEPESLKQELVDS